jgi:hypothetical protein
MVIRRPTPELIQARKWEIRRRYEHHARVGKRTRSMAAIRIAELMRWLDDLIGQGVELDPSSATETIARVFVHHFVVLADGNRRAAQWLATYCPWISIADREYMITEANHCPIKWSADNLAWKIRLSDVKRTELKITTIGAINCNKDQRAIRRKQRRAGLMRNLREQRRQARVNSI